MKKFYLFATAVTMLTACTNSEKMTADFSNDDPVMIGFETFHEKSTKAAATGAIEYAYNLTKNATGKGGFGVWGYKGSATNITTYGNEDPTPNMGDLSNTSNFTKIFNNVQVWYDADKSTPTATPPHYHFTYAVPKYWDKESEYAFFAYAPWDNTNAEFAPATGTITIKDIAGIQDVSKVTGSTGSSIKYSDSDASGVTDYLMATYVTDQKYKGTNQSTASYDDKDQTVGFIFGHMLSKLQVNVKAQTAYSGIKEIIVNYLSIENMPALGTDLEKTIFTQTSPTASAGTYNPTYYAKNLQIINSNSTENANANATSKNALYVLFNGSLNAETQEPVPPTAQTQSFNYYVAPNNPSTNATVANQKHKLNISYTITYVDNITEDVIIEGYDISDKFGKMEQNKSYILNINIDLKEILFTASVTGWDNNIEKEIDIP